MTTYTLSIPASRCEAERIADLLEQVSHPAPLATGFFCQTGETWQAEAHYHTCPDAALIAERLGGAGIAQEVVAALSVEHQKERDWVAHSQAGLAPVSAGGFFVHGSHDRARAGRHRLAIEIDAAMAFGTAHHPTTTGCLEAIGDLARGTSGAIRRVLDVGTGSGILAIAAVKVLSPDLVVATDIDPVAVRTAKENFARNGVRRRMYGAVVAGLTGRAIAANGPFDLVVANILAGPLKAMSADMARHTAAGGYAVLSGLLTEQSRPLEASFRAAGFDLVRRYRREEWMTLLLRRRRGAAR